MDLLRWNICNISHARSKYIDIQWWYNISTGAAAAAATRSIYYFYIHIRMLLKLPFRNVYTTRNEDRENKTNESQYFKGEATLENCCAFDRISYQQQRYMYTLEMIYIKNRNKEINARVIYCIITLNSNHKSSTRWNSSLPFLLFISKYLYINFIII